VTWYLVKYRDNFTLTNIHEVIKSRSMGWPGYVAYLKDMRSRYKILVGKPEGNRLLGRRRRRWENKTKKLGMEMCSILKQIKTEPIRGFL
jgi:hypothetical protein